MKLLYSILFFMLIIALFAMEFVFLSILNRHKSFWLVILSFAGIVTSIILLLFFLSRFFKLPFWGGRK